MTINRDKMSQILEKIELLSVSISRAIHNSCCNNLLSEILIDTIIEKLFT